MGLSLNWGGLNIFLPQNRLQRRPCGLSRIGCRHPQRSVSEVEGVGRLALMGREVLPQYMDMRPVKGGLSPAGMKWRMGADDPGWAGAGKRSPPAGLSLNWGGYNFYLQITLPSFFLHKASRQTPFPSRRRKKSRQCSNGNLPLFFYRKTARS